MKYFCFTIFIFILPHAVFSQTVAKSSIDNIIPNPGFERYSSAPIGWFYKGKHFTDVMKYWSSATAASPDVFGPRVRVPAHWAAKGFGAQKARTGESMVGITVYGCEEGKPHCREYIQIQLVEPLVIGQGYYAEFWVSSLPKSLEIDGIGMYFSNVRINEKTDAPIEYQPQILSDRIIKTPNHSWVRISGRFVAKEESEYLIIGNFNTDSQTKVNTAKPSSLNYAYYYIDDVLLKKEKPIIEVPVKEDDLCCITLEEGKIIRLKNIFFDHDKAELLPRSNLELNKLLFHMQENPNMVIEISGHTDSSGDRDYNKYLSRKRAKAVVEFLNKNGISKHRTRYAGYGDARPIASNDNEGGRQLNRRVEFLILRK